MHETENPPDHGISWLFRDKMIIYNIDINIIWAILIFFTSFMIIYNSIISFGEPYLPLFVLELFRYGKTLDGPVKNPLVKLISVPKTYFTHFYIFSSVYVPALLLMALYYYTNQTKVSQITDRTPSDGQC